MQAARRTTIFLLLFIRNSLLAFVAACISACHDPATQFETSLLYKKVINFTCQNAIDMQIRDLQFDGDCVGTFVLSCLFNLLGMGNSAPVGCRLSTYVPSHLCQDCQCHFLAIELASHRTAVASGTRKSTVSIFFFFSLISILRFAISSFENLFASLSRYSHCKV